MMNLVRNTLSEKEVPKQCWAEAVNWVAHVLNRSPTLAVKNMTPEEAWSGVKLKVDYFRIVGCVGHVHIPDAKRIKLDDKSCKCILFGINEGTKAYRLLNPATGKILVSRDVIFEEDKGWNWGRIADKKEIKSAELQDEEENPEVGDEEKKS